MYLSGIKINASDIGQVKDKAIDQSGDDRSFFGKISLQEDIDKIHGIENTEPFHLDRENEVKPDDIVGICHGKDYIYGNIDDILPDIDAIFAAFVALAVSSAPAKNDIVVIVSSVL